MPPTILFPSITIHGHAMMPEIYEKQEEGSRPQRFQGHSIFVTFSTGETAHMILHESGLDAYNRAMEADFKHLKVEDLDGDAESRALAAAEKRLAESTASGVKGDQG